MIDDTKKLGLNDTVLFENSKYKDTKLLLEDIKGASSYSKFVNKNKSSLIDDNIKKALGEIIFARNLEIQEFADKVGISKAFAYQILNGSRRPTRDKLIVIGLKLFVTIDELNNLLLSAGKKRLYAKNKRDAAVIYAITHNITLQKLNKLLKDEGIETFK